MRDAACHPQIDDGFGLGGTHRPDSPASSAAGKAVAAMLNEPTRSRSRRSQGARDIVRLSRRRFEDYRRAGDG